MLHATLVDDPRVEALRAQLPVVARRAYLNTGTTGPLPRVVSDAIAAEAVRELEEGRLGSDRFDRFRELQRRTRAALAEALDVSVEEVALTGSTSDGINIVAQGLSWREGDEIVTTDAEHEGVILPLAVLRQRHGVVVRFAAVGPDDDSTVAAIAAQLSPRTRLLVFSHVIYATGAVLPLARLAALAHERGLPVLCDGAQAFGAMPLDLHATGVDFYAVSGQKWLCGPEGTGGLYVRRDALPLLAPTFVGYASMATRDAQGYYLPQPGARRFEAGMRYPPATAGQCASLEWWRDEVGPAWAYARIHELAARLIAGLHATAGVEVVTSPGAHAGLVSFQVHGLPPEAVVERLTQDHGILCRSIPSSPLIRLSTGWYNTVEEIDRAVDAVAAIAAAGVTGS